MELLLVVYVLVVFKLEYQAALGPQYELVYFLVPFTIFFLRFVRSAPVLLVPTRPTSSIWVELLLVVYGPAVCTPEY